MIGETVLAKVMQALLGSGSKNGDNRGMAEKQVLA
jgi:hypothetical protein